MARIVCPVVIGRDRELAGLVGALDRARAGAGTAVALVGEAGIGKSRLVREAVNGALERRMVVARGRAVAATSPAPFRPVVEALADAVRARGVPESSELTPFRTFLGRVVPELADERTPLDVSTVLVAEAVLRLLRAQASGQGCLVVFEDVHWADAETLAIVEYLADNLAAEPIVCVVTIRNDDPSPGLDLVRALTARGTAMMVELPRLDETQVGEVIARCLDVDDVPDELLARVAQFAEGVPFLVEEVLSCDDSVVPASFAAVVEHRLAGFDAASRRVICAAAVVGRSFEWELLEQSAGVDGSTVRTALERAVAEQLVVVDHGVFRFRHALTRDAVLAASLPIDVRDVASRALAALERTSPGLPGGAITLAADLAERAGDGHRAAVLLFEAGRRARASGALATAEQLLRRGRDTTTDAHLEVEFAEALCEVLAFAGKTEEVGKVGAQLLADLDRLDASNDRVVTAHVLLAQAAVTASRWDDTDWHIAAARERGELDPAVATRIDVLAAAAALGRGRFEDAAALAGRAAASADRLGIGEVHCEALLVVGRCARARDLHDAATMFDAALSQARRRGLPLWELRALHELGTVDLFDRGDLSRLYEARSLATDAGALATAATLGLELAGGHSVRAEPAAMLTVSRESARAAERFGWIAIHAMALQFEANAFALMGDRVAMEAVAARAIEMNPDDLNQVGHIWLGARAVMSLVEEDRARAIGELDTGMRILRLAATTVPSHLKGLWALVRAVEDKDGRAAVEELRSSGALVNRLNRAYVAYAEAVLSGRAGRPAEATAAIAVADGHAAHAPWWRHHARRLVSELALVDGWGDPVGWLNDAAAWFDTTGHDHIASACRSLLRRAGVVAPRRPPARVPPAWREMGITAREAEVLTLVGEGLHNREIADRLYVSTRTIEKHVESLLRKTAARSRSGLAALAVRIRSSTDAEPASSS